MEGSRFRSLSNGVDRWALVRGTSSCPWWHSCWLRHRSGLKTAVRWSSLPANRARRRGPCIPAPCGPSFYFQADWLWTSHAGLWSDTRNFIDGPDAASFNNLPTLTGDNGYRFQGGCRLGRWIFEGVYSHFGDWDASLNENVNGVAFNTNALAGNWAGPT